MPNRIVREGILTSSRIASLSLGAEVLYRRILSVVDDYGRYHGSVVTLRAACWPTNPEKIRANDVSKWLTELIAGDSPLIKMYNVKGATYLEVQDFNQPIRSKSKFPQAPWTQPESNMKADCTQSSLTMRSAYSDVRSSECVVRSANSEPTHGLVLAKPLDVWADELYERHPKKKDRVLVGSALLSVLSDTATNSDDLIGDIDRVHALWCRSRQWKEKNGQFAPSLAKWILDHGWKKEPDLTPPLPENSRQQAAMDEMERRLLRDGRI